MLLQYKTIDYRNLNTYELEYQVHGVVNGTKLRQTVVEILQIEVGVHGCSNTNRNENYYFLSSRGVGSFDEGNKSQLVRGSTDLVLGLFLS